MKFFAFINKLLFSCLVLFSFLGIYDIYLLRNWLEKRFLDRFRIVFILKEEEDIQQELVLQNIKKSCRLLNIKEINYLDKNQIYEMVAKNEEMRALLSVIKTNPFRDSIILEFENYVEEEVRKILNLKNNFSEIKEIIYDYNVKSYLSRLYKIKKIFDRVAIGFIVCLFIVISLRLALFGKNKVLFLTVLFFSIIYILAIILNVKFINTFFFDLIKIDRLNIAVNFFIYVFCLTYIFEDGTEKSVIQKQNQDNN